jgi:uncharacterized protein YbjT (DUF2867 family)
MDTKNKILVTGATGKQGGAVAQSLLDRNHEVIALVRDPKKPAAEALAKAGAKLLVGNFDDSDSLKRALEGAHCCFSVQNFFEVGYQKEVDQGCRIAELAKEAGVQHFVYSSVIGADRNSNIPHFESKWEVEKYLKKIGIKSTVLRAVAYMDNWITFNWFTGDKLYIPMKADRKWQMIASRDIGEFAAIVFSQPESYSGQALEIAGDEFTMPQAAKKFSATLGKTVHYVEQPIEEVRQFSEEIALMFDWFNDRANFADLAKLKEIHPTLWTLEEWLKSTELAKQTQHAR